MEKISSVDKIVAKIPESEKEKIFHEMGERFNNQIFEDLNKKERKKTSEELMIIDLVNEETNKIRHKYGLEDFNIPPENIHVIKEKKWPKEKVNALFKSEYQGIAMRERSAKIAFVKTLFHELTHFKSYNAWQITKSNSPELDEYRLGLLVYTRDGKNIYFENLNEAVTEEMTIRFARGIINNPIFEKELRQTKEIIEKYQDTVTYSGKPLFDEDTFYAEIQNKKNWGNAIGRLRGYLFGVRIEIFTEAFSYKGERKILNILINKIFFKNPEEFKDREEIFEIFAKGMITGDILPLGRLIESTFGKGTFRKIGELDNDIKAQRKFVNGL